MSNQIQSQLFSLKAKASTEKFAALRIRREWEGRDEIGLRWDGMGIKLACMHMLELEGYKYKVVESDTQYWLE